VRTILPEKRRSPRGCGGSRVLKPQFPEPSLAACPQDLLARRSMPEAVNAPIGGVAFFSPGCTPARRPLCIALPPSTAPGSGLHPAADPEGTWAQPCCGFLGDNLHPRNTGRRLPSGLASPMLVSPPNLAPMLPRNAAPQCSPKRSTSARAGWARVAFALLSLASQ
jgi:hypothetical protein